MAGEPPAPGMIALITPDGTARQVADGIEFGNGMAITADDRTLIVAESYANRLTAFDIAPDGTLAEPPRVGRSRRRRPRRDLHRRRRRGLVRGRAEQACRRVREGGEVLHTIDVDRGCFACMLGGSEGRTLFIVAREWHGADRIETANDQDRS